MGVGLWLLGAGKWMGGIAAALFKWLFADVRRIIIAVLAIACLIFWLQLGSVRADRDTWKLASQNWEEALKQTEINYRAAAKKATEKQQAKIVAVKAQQAAINERVTDELEESRNDADARYKRLLDRKAATDPRRTGTIEMSAFAESTCLAVAATSCDDIPALLKAAQDNTDQLLAAQAWMRSVGEIETSPDP